jgi:pre-rRNA-processing protein IPI3
MIWTASMDRTCKLWDIESGGQCLLTLIFPSQPISVLMNRTESLVLIGTFDGTIYRFDLRNHVGANVVHINDSGSSNGEEERRKYAYRGGHQLPVLCLALSLDGSCVYSGCDQGLVNCWDLQSGQKLRSWGPLKGPITNLQLLIKSELLFAGGGNTITELIYPNTLKRSINVPYEGMSWKMEVHNDDYDRNMIKRVMAPPEVAQSAVDEKEQIVPSDNCESDSIAQLQTQIKQLKQINNELYQQLIKQRSI